MESDTGPQYQILVVDDDRDMVDTTRRFLETKGYRVLQGFRGEMQKDIASLVRLVMQVSQLAARYPQIKEVDLNPIRVYENGYSVLDARILLDAE